MTCSTLDETRDEKRLRIRKELASDFELYAPRCLKIRPKAGAPIAFALNRAQRHIHERLEAQRAETGRVRAIILKGRQQGCSTYVGGRFYWRATHSRGVKVFILTHEDQATANLFEMVKRYHDNSPALVRPVTGRSSEKELSFPRLDSAYKVGTAGNKGAGRSLTAQLFHGSEVAFWPNAEEHAAGVMQAIANEPGTEIILESTAKGVGNFFHQHWQDAEAGRNGYIAVFVPWFWQHEYRLDPPADFALDDTPDDLGESEVSYAEVWGLDAGQMFWRRRKIAELKSVTKFREEYPACAAEAFQNSGHDSYIPASLVVRARKASVTESGSLVIGYDPAWTGDDGHAMAFRRGRRLLEVRRKAKLDTMQAAGWCKSVIDAESPAAFFVDVGGVGAGVYDRLVEMGYGKVVTAVNFGSSPFEVYADDGGPANRRAEMWMKSREWLEHAAGAQIPDEDLLQAEACGPGYKWTSSSQLLLERKEDMRRRKVKSPDGWDAVALTFAEPVIERAPRTSTGSGGRRGWMGG